MRRQNSVCVVTTPAGTIAAISVMRLADRRDVAIRQTRPLESPVRQEPPGFLGRHVQPGRRRDPPRTAGRACLRSPAGPPRRTTRGRRVTFSSRPNRRSHPSGLPSGGPAPATCARRSRSVVRSRVRKAACPSADERELRRCQPDRVGRRRRVVAGRQRIELRVRADSKSRADFVRAAAGARHDDHEAQAAVNGKDRVGVVEADDRVERRSIEQPRPQVRRAVVGREAPRQNHADASAGPRERQRALEKGLIQVHVAAIAAWVEAGLADETHQVVVPQFRGSGVAGFSCRAGVDRAAAFPTADCRSPRRSPARSATRPDSS